MKYIWNSKNLWHKNVSFSLHVQFSCSVLSDSLRPMNCSMPGFPVLPRVCSNSWPLIQWCHPTHLILCHHLLLLPSVFPCIRVFSSELVLGIRWPKYWSVSFIINPSNAYSQLTFFRIDWFDLLAVQGTLKSLLQHQCVKATIFQCSAFFMVQLTSVTDCWKNHSFD